MFLARSVTTLVALLLGVHYVAAQKVDLDRYRFTMQYRDLPKRPLPLDYRTYRVLFATTRAIRSTYGDDLAERVRIDGWRRMPDDRAHVTIRPEVDDVLIEKTDVRERVEVQKDKTGKETGRKYYYTLWLEYSFAARADVVDYQNRRVWNTDLASRSSRKTYTSQEFTTHKAATDYLNNNREELKNRFARQETERVLAELSGQLSDNFGFPVRQHDDFFWVLDSKRHPEFAAYQDAHQTLKGALARVSPDQPLDAVRQQLVPTLAYLEALTRKYTSADKADAKLRYSAWYNLAKIHLLLDEPEKTLTYADELARCGYDEADGRLMQRRAEELQALFRQNQTQTRHFAINPDELLPPRR